MRVVGPVSWHIPPFLVRNCRRLPGNTDDRCLAKWLRTFSWATLATRKVAVIHVSSRAGVVMAGLIGKRLLGNAEVE
jgi:hypothetical protein